MEVGTILADIRKRASEDPEVRQKLLDTRKAEDPTDEFCRVAQDLGYPLYLMDLISAGEEMYALMKRSVNGGGENSPMLEGEDDYYSQLMADLERM